jgi:hypothetical protein
LLEELPKVKAGLNKKGKGKGLSRSEGRGIIQRVGLLVKKCWDWVGAQPSIGSEEMDKVKVCMSFISLLVFVRAMLIFILGDLARAAFKNSALVYEIRTVEFGAESAGGGHA